MEGSDVDNPWQRYIDAASGVTDVTKRTAETVVSRLVQQGEIAADRAERAVDDLLARSERNRKGLSSLVRTEVERVVDRFGLAQQEDLDELSSRVDDLRRTVERLEAEQARRGAKRSTTKAKSS